MAQQDPATLMDWGPLPKSLLSQRTITDVSTYLTFYRVSLPLFPRILVAIEYINLRSTIAQQYPCLLAQSGLNV